MEKDINYQPMPGDLIWVQEPGLEPPSPKPYLVARKATAKDKIDWVLSIQKKITQFESIDKSALKEFFKEDSWMCLDGRQENWTNPSSSPGLLDLISRVNILKEVKPEDYSESGQENLQGSLGASP